MLKGLLEELPKEGAHEIEQLHRGYLSVGYSAQEERAREQGNHSGLQDDDAHLGVVGEVAQDTAVPFTPRVESRRHQQLDRAKHRLEQGEIQEYARLQEPGRDDKGHCLNPTALQRGRRA